MRKFRVRNLERHQHYKDRAPPWIKLYFSILDDYEFSRLQDASKLQAIFIWLLASRSDNCLPWDPAWIKQRINVSSKVDLDALQAAGFIEEIADASGALAPCLQDARPEERRGEESIGRKNGKFIPPTVDEVRSYVTEKGYGIDPERFVDHYEANGWIRGKTKIKDWQACVRTWVKNEPTPEKPFGHDAL